MSVFAAKQIHISLPSEEAAARNSTGEDTARLDNLAMQPTQYSSSISFAKTEATN